VTIAEPDGGRLQASSMADIATRMRSLGLRTDLMFVAWQGRVDDLGDAVRAYTPTSPDYYFGNFLLFPDAPGAEDVARWTARFRAAFEHDRRIRHVCLCWDRPDGAGGATGALEAAGFVVDRCSVLTARAVRPPRRPNCDTVLRDVASEADWAAVERLQVSTSIARFGPQCERWARGMAASHRQMVEAGRGRWFGAFAGPEPDAPLLGDLGLFVQDGTARFQAVETDPRHRRRGICATLVHHAAGRAFAEMGAHVLVMASEPDSDAQRVYESVGFAVAERLVAAYRASH
jgi:ribosomal protein S18 acetylase RimI-like enzyme